MWRVVPSAEEIGEREICSTSLSSPLEVVHDSQEAENTGNDSDD